jgi:hypothetical protein
MTATEAFPLLSTTDKLPPLAGPNSVDKTRTRRRSSGLGGEIRAGDTSAPALATLDLRPPSPGTLKVSRSLSTMPQPISHLAGAKRQRPQEALLETAESQNSLSTMETIRLETHLGHPSRPPWTLPLSICDKPILIEPYTSLYLPVISYTT